MLSPQDQAATSHLVQSAKASFWRGVLQAFPQLIDFSRNASQSEIEDLRGILGKLSEMADLVDSNNECKRFADFICEEDLTSVGYWVLHAKAEEREAFLSLVEKVADANKFVMGACIGFATKTMCKKCIFRKLHNHFSSYPFNAQDRRVFDPEQHA